jgi:hypothetical protein
MPYILSKAKGGYFVKTEDTGKRHSNKPLSKEMAERQMKALYYAMKNSKK